MVGGALVPHDGRMTPPAPRRLAATLLALMLTGAAAACGGPDGATSAIGPTPAGLAAADSLVAAWVADDRVAGAVLSVRHEGRTVLSRASGWASSRTYGSGQYGLWREDGDRSGGPRPVDEPEAMTLATVFDLASVTKVAATTFALMMLVDDGTVSLDAPASTYLPDFVGGGREAITLRHLLTHTSGLRQWVPTYYHAADPDAAWAYVRALPLGWPVGQERRYSDLGFMALGRVVEAVSGQRLDGFLAERLYGPLGLASTGFRPPDAVASGRPAEGTSADPASAGPLLAATSHGNPFEYRMVHDPEFGYRIEGDPDAWDGWRRYTLRGQVNDGNAWHAFGGVAGHAGLFSTADDLHALLAILLGGGEASGRRWIAADVVREFLTEMVSGQALGWQVPPGAPAGSVHHTGFTGTWVLAVPALDLSVVLLTNRQHGGVGPDDRYPDLAPLQQSVADALLGGG